MIIFFRGKAATGKTKLSKLVSNYIKYKTIDKDTVFDSLLTEGYNCEVANSKTYKLLAKTIQEKYDHNENLIIDIGLAHTPYFLEFLSKLEIDPQDIRLFLFICSDQQKWSNRIRKRIENSNVPNQYFKSVQEAMNHYNKYNIFKLDNEQSETFRVREMKA